MEGDGASLLADAEANPENVFFQKQLAKAPKLEHPFYWNAFQELSTERQIGMSIGKIPISKMWDWAELNDLTLSEAIALVYVMKEMDNAMLRIQAKQSEKQKQAMSRSAQSGTVRRR